MVGRGGYGAQRVAVVGGIRVAVSGNVLGLLDDALYAVRSTPIWILPIAHWVLGEKLSVKLVLLTLGAVSGVILMILGPHF